MSIAYDTEAEDRARANALRAWGITVPRDASAIVARKPLAAATTRQRKPLGLRPIIEDELEDDTAEPEPPVREDNRPAWLSDIDHLIRHERKFALGIVGQVIGESTAEVRDDVTAALRKEFGELKETVTRLAGMENAIGALKNENTALRLILESLRIREKGERGESGERGAPGRDGVQGPVGPRGEQGPAGPRGVPAARTVSWEVDDNALVAYPVLQTGHRGPGLRMKSILDAYSDQIAASDADE